MAQTAPQVIEQFHLAFLDALRTTVDPGRYVLKGGANLRYFFGSVRYSEDIDLDIYGLAADWKFAEQVTKTLEGDAVTRLLRVSQTSVDEVTAQKQSETTRRWRIWLKAPGHAARIRTKVEFSDRNGDTRFELEPVPDAIVAPYAMRPPVVQRYLLDSMIEQKVLALAQRPQTQARDVFDLDMLLRRGGVPAGALPDVKLQAAAEAAVELDWASFEDMVLPFLDASLASNYDRAAWNRMQDFVAGELLP